MDISVGIRILRVTINFFNVVIYYVSTQQHMVLQIIGLPNPLPTVLCDSFDWHKNGLNVYII